MRKQLVNYKKQGGVKMETNEKQEVKGTVWLWTVIGIVAGGLLGSLLGPLGTILGGGITGILAYRSSSQNGGNAPAWLWQSKSSKRMEAEIKSGNGVENVGYKIPANWKEDKYAWIYLGCVVITQIIIAFSGGGFIILYAIVTYLMMRKEENLAEKAGMWWPLMVWILFPIVYFWQRLTALKQPRIHFWIILGVSLGVSIIISCLKS